MGDVYLGGNLASVLVVLGQEVQKGLGLVAEGLGPVQGTSNELSVPELHKGNGT